MREKPRLIRAQMVDEHGNPIGDRTIRQDELRTGPKVREALSPDLQQRVMVLYNKVGNLLYSSPAEWIDGFLHDQHPDREIALWERMSRLLPDARGITGLPKAKALRLLVAISSGLVDPGAHFGLDDKKIEAVRALWDSDAGC